jgi:hypothetical protein
MGEIRITEKDYKELQNVLDGYVSELSKLDVNSNEYRNLKHQLDNKACGLYLLQEHEIICNEFDIGNVMIENNILTCIYDNKIHKYKMLKRKATKGELVYITNAEDTCPFGKRYIGRAFYISSDEDKCKLAKNHVVIYTNGFNTGWCLYDDQYVVLEEINQ